MLNPKDAIKQLKKEVFEARTKFLKRKIKQYLKTCDSTAKDEYYDTDRGISSSVLINFMAWLKEQKN